MKSEIKDCLKQAKFPEINKLLVHSEVLNDLDILSVTLMYKECVYEVENHAHQLKDNLFTVLLEAKSLDELKNNAQNIIESLKAMTKFIPIIIKLK